MTLHLYRLSLQISQIKVLENPPSMKIQKLSSRMEVLRVNHNLLSLRPYGGWNYEIGNCSQHDIFILLRWVRPWFVFSFEIILIRKHFSNCDLNCVIWFTCFLWVFRKDIFDKFAAVNFVCVNFFCVRKMFCAQVFARFEVFSFCV